MQLKILRVFRRSLADAKVIKYLQRLRGVASAGIQMPGYRSLPSNCSQLVNIWPALAA